VIDRQALRNSTIARTKRTANAELRLAAVGARQHEAGQIGAGDQQDDADGGHDDPEHGAEVTDDVQFQRM